MNSGSRNPLRLVVADDIEELRLLIRMQLDDDPRFEVVGEASNGEEAVEATMSLQPDVLLLDVAMPVMDGLEAIPKVHEAAPGCKIFMLSAFSDSGTRQQALSLSAHSFLDKGSVVGILAETIAQSFLSPKSA